MLVLCVVNLLFLFCDILTDFLFAGRFKRYSRLYFKCRLLYFSSFNFGGFFLEKTCELEAHTLSKYIGPIAVLLTPIVFIVSKLYIP